MAEGRIWLPRSKIVVIESYGARARGAKVWKKERGKRSKDNNMEKTKSNTHDKVDTGVGTDMVSLIAVENRIMN